VERKSAPARRAQIADAALKVIAEQGLGRFTAAAVAREIGVTDAALFRHFPSMDALVKQAIARVGEILFEGFPPEADDPLERLRLFFERRVAVIHANPGVARLVVSEQLDQAAGPEEVAQVVQYRRRSWSFVRDCLREAGRQRLLLDGLGTDEATVIVLGSLMSLTHARGAVASDVAVPELAHRVWLALEMLLRRSPRRRAMPRPARRA
jgi:AcrR family transcriptional regulator